MTNEMDRRMFMSRAALLVGGLGLAPALLAACGGSDDSGDASDTSGAGEPGATTPASAKVLRTAFLSDMSAPDPDINYEVEALLLMLSVYEGLVGYKPGTKEIAPALATAWEVSPDGLTYTFTLREGVTFHDGTPLDATAFVSSFARRTAVAEAPSYMLAGVASTAAPDATTFVVTLTQPVQPFLDYLACPWGPKAVSPAAIAANETAGDLAKAWLETHDAGTGPFTISEFVPSTRYILTAYDGYWGTKADVGSVEIAIIPDASTQRLQLESGDLDLVTKGMPIGDVEHFRSTDGFTVETFPTAAKTALFLNAANGIFADQALRQALRVAVDRSKLIEPTYGDTATISTEFFPTAYLAATPAPDDPALDVDTIKPLVEALSSKGVDIGYSETGGATDQRLAELLQVQLAELGFDATVRSIPLAQLFGLFAASADEQPDILVSGAGGDGLNGDMELRVFFRTDTPPLNWFNYSDAEVDDLMDQGAGATDAAVADKSYADAAAVIVDQAWVINLADLSDVIVARAGITNFVHGLESPKSIRLNELKVEA